jgi:hypothetical protein
MAGRRATRDWPTCNVLFGKPKGRDASGHELVER